MANIKCNGKIQSNSVDVNNTIALGRKDGTVVSPSITFHTEGTTTNNVTLQATGKQLQLSGDLKITGNIYLG